MQLFRASAATPQAMYPDLPIYSRGLPMLTDLACSGSSGCTSCVDACPTAAIKLDFGSVRLDLGLCIACGECTSGCPSGTIAEDRRTKVAVRDRSDLVLNNAPNEAGTKPSPPVIVPVPNPFSLSLHVRSVSTGDNASDLELSAANNPIFDAGRFGVHIVASPRFADALVVTGPVGRAMREPLLRCWEAMAEPRMVFAAGASAISGGIHRGGYAHADGVDSILPVAVYIPGSPPHPWYILHGLLLAMGHKSA